MDRQTRKALAANVRFLYLKLNTGGNVTVAFVRSFNRKVLYWAISLCSPTDSFSKKRGRELAKKRLMLSLQDETILCPSWASTCTVNPSDKLEDQMRGISSLLLEAIKRKSDFYPRWMQKATEITPRKMIIKR